MFNTSYITQILKKLYPERRNDKIEGQHIDLEKWKNWYRGTTPLHMKETIRDSKKTKVRMFSSNFAKQICEDWACSYANEETELRINKTKDDEIIQKILKENGVFKKWNSFVDKFMGLGCGATVELIKEFEVDERGHIKKGEDNEIKISFIDADRVVPITIDDGEVTECAFVRYSTNEATLQCHFLNENKEYEIVEVKGKYAKENTYNFDYTTMIKWETKSKTPLFQVWYPNVVDNHWLSNQIGASVYANSLDWLFTLDTIMDAYYTEFKNGRKKRFISTDLLVIDQEGQKVKVPLEEDDVYIPQGNGEDLLVQELNPQLRNLSFEQAIEFVANMIGKQCGLGDARYQFSGEGRPLQTATAVMAKEVAGYRNVIKQENFSTDRFTRMLLGIKFLYNTFIADTLTFEIDDITIKYDDNIAEDTASKKAQELQEMAAGAMAPEEFRAHWYSEDEEEAKKYLQEHAMLTDKYLLALQSGAMTPSQFVERVYGDCPDKEEVIAYITEHLQTPPEMGEDELANAMVGMNPNAQEEDEDDE